MAPHNGKCLCGAVRFKISSDPKLVLSCFCAHCQKGSGGTNQLVAKFAEKDVDITSGQDHITYYSSTDTTSGNPKEKSFCKTCGCTLWTVPAAAKGELLIIRTPILDDGLQLQPSGELFTPNRPKWMTPIKDATQFEGMNH